MTDETITIEMFKMWLTGVEEMQKPEWHPTASQWRTIRAKIDQLVEIPPQHIPRHNPPYGQPPMANQVQPHGYATIADAQVTNGEVPIGPDDDLIDIINRNKTNFATAPIVLDSTVPGGVPLMLDNRTISTNEGDLGSSQTKTSSFI